MKIFPAATGSLRLLRTVKPIVTNIRSSGITDKLIITVSSPIRDAEDTIVGILGIDIRFEDLAKLEEDGE